MAPGHRFCGTFRPATLLQRRQAGVSAADRPARSARARPRLRRRPQRRAAQAAPARARSSASSSTPARPRRRASVSTASSSATSPSSTRRDLGDEPFDAILASDVLEHLLDAEDVLARARHAPAPGRRRRHLAAQRRPTCTCSRQPAAQDAGRGAARASSTARTCASSPSATWSRLLRGRRPARAARRAVLHALPGDQGRVPGPVAVRLPRLLGAAVPAARRQAG